MNRWLFTIAILIAMDLAPRRLFALSVGDHIPGIAVADKAGQSTKPWTGKTTLINFWATWCEACKVELHEMEREIQKNSQDQNVVFVSLDKDASKAESYMVHEFSKTPAMTNSLYFDNTFKFADALGVDSFPLTVIVDSNGKIVKIQEGFKEGAGSTVSLFNTLRDQK